MQSFTIPIARSIKGLLMMLCDSIMIVVALGFSFALLGKDYLNKIKYYILLLQWH